MKTIYPEIERHFNHIIQSEIFRINGHAINLPDAQNPHGTAKRVRP